MSATAVDEECLAGLPLAQLAAVRAALAAPFELDVVLAVEHLTAEAWAEGELAWKERLAADPDAMARYRQLLVAAEDRLARRVRPLDDDLEAWTRFVRAYAADAGAFGLLGRLGLGLGDLARLQRQWAQKLEHPVLARRADELGHRLDELVARGEPVRVPPVVLGPRELRPSRAAAARRAREANARAVAARPPGTPLGLAAYAALCAELAEGGSDARPAVAARHGIPPDELDAVHAAWRARLAADRALAADFRALAAHHERRLRLRADVRHDASPAGALGLDGPPLRADPASATLARAAVFPWELRPHPRPRPPEVDAQTAPAGAAPEPLPATPFSAFDPLPFGRGAAARAAAAAFAAFEPLPFKPATGGAPRAAARAAPPVDDPTVLPVRAGPRPAPVHAEAAPPVAAPALTLSELALLHAELAVHPRRARAIRRRFRLRDEAMQHEVLRAYAYQLAADPDLHAEYERLFEEHVATLRAGRRP
ncbi:MAG: hypothetical protein IT373_03565 [Polyangiaceae bacterium]|nr:hypothetical protein [Polyangiaceae bacterium]